MRRVMEPHRTDSPTSPAHRVVYSHHSAPSDEIMLERKRGRCRARRDAQLGVDVLHVAGDRVLADDEDGGDVAVGLPACEESQYLELARGEPVGGPGRLGLESCEIRGRLQVAEGLAGCVALECRGLAVAQGG